MVKKEHAWQGFPYPGHGGDHWWRAAQQNLDTVGRFRAMFVYNILSNKPNAARPTFRWVVENIMNLEVIVFSRQSVQILLEEDVLLVDVGENKAQLRLIFRILEHSTNDLNNEEWRKR
ncbi:hypothetical protein BC938DRAFT_482762 [Jimgerdemannia flammicorona]|uniref:Uncharacterized protein n=1 Tax=Jimgerdemannia flammicorona TaxID=994334 RepID=A0A433R0F0_9FUNG|nr:hypothetical protein BC938DRAFT_482762 [Jimgerdemannia flammicorona]